MDVKLLRPIRFEGKIYKEGTIIKGIGRHLREFLLKLKVRSEKPVCIFGDAKDFEKSVTKPKSKKDNKQEVNNGTSSKSE